MWAIIERILPLKNKINSLLIPDMQLCVSIQSTQYIDKFTNARLHNSPCSSQKLFPVLQGMKFSFQME